MLTEKLAKSLRPSDKPIFDKKVTGLILTPSQSGCKWILRFTSPNSKKRRDAGLGTYPTVSIAEARNKASEMRKLIDQGIDPIDARKKERSEFEPDEQSLIFEKAATLVHQELKSSWKNEKHSAQWISTLRTYVFPKLGSKKLEQITPADCAEVLRPIWLSKVETASRTRQRMHTVMQWAWAHGYISANPVAVIDHILPKQSHRPEHQPAMPWRQIKQFLSENVQNLEISDSTKACLLLLILTATRSGEARNATWDEFDLVGRVWNVPAERMKTGVAHRIPLSTTANELVRNLANHRLHDSLVFPSPRGKVLSDMTLTAFLRRAHATSDIDGRTATVHGFRSSFRDWASENGYSRDLAERALAHTVINKVEAAYHRTDLLDQRRPMMEAWANQIMRKSSLKKSQSMSSFFRDPKSK